MNPVRFVLSALAVAGLAIGATGSSHAQSYIAKNTPQRAEMVRISGAAAQ
jgi:hypothetical protein